MMKLVLLSAVALGVLSGTASAAYKPKPMPGPCPLVFCKPGPPLPIPPHIPKPLPY